MTTWLYRAGAAALVGAAALSLGACQASRPASVPPSEPAVVSDEPPAAGSQLDQATGSRLLADTRQPIGGACGGAEDCMSGVCEGHGCGERAGLCVEVERSCAEDKVLFCGCDGQSFAAPSNCPGEVFASRGACPDAAAAAPQ